MLKDETALIADRIRRKEAYREERRSSESEDDQSHPTQHPLFLPITNGLPSPECSTLSTHPLKPSLELYSLCFFFSNYCTIPHDPQTSSSFLEYLLPVYSRVSPGHPLSQATSAVAINLASMWAYQQPDTADARVYYTKAVTSTKAALTDGTQTKTDELLLAVMLLDFYDALSQRYMMRNPIGTHHDGALALAKHRGSANFQNATSKALLLTVRNRLVASALQNRKGVSFDPDLWTDASDMCHYPTTTLTLLAAEVANLQVLASNLRPARSRPSSPSAFSVLSEDPADATSFVESLLEQALDVDRRLYAWPASTPDSWKPVPITTMDDIHPTIHTAGLYNSLCDVYSSLQVVSIYNNWRCTSVTLLQVMEKLRRALSPESIGVSVLPENYTRTRIQQLIDGICASVPYHLGNHVHPTKPTEYTGVEYPRHPIGPDGKRPTLFGANAQGHTVELSHTDYMRAAISIGGWYILNTLLAILQAARPASDARLDDPTPLQLRPGQMSWILGQLKRLQELYLIPTPQPCPCG